MALAAYADQPLKPSVLLYGDLRDWLRKVEEMGQLKIVEGAERDLEIGTITELNAKRQGSPALLFDRIKGFSPGYRVLTSLLLTSGRLALTYGFHTNLSEVELRKKFRGKPLEWENASGKFPPQFVEKGAVLENIQMGKDVDVLKFPSPKWHELDGGRYIGTGCAVITKDPDTGLVNLGTYRVQVVDEKRVTLYISPGKHGRIHYEKYHQGGRPCPVAVSVGHDPLVFVAAALEVPTGICEYNYMGAIAGEPYRVVRGPVTGLPIPASAEIVLEGWCYPGDLHDEGPFGEWTGYYASGMRPAPVIQVRCVMQRNDPIILGVPPNRPPHDYTYMRSVLRSAMLLDALTKAGVPDVKDVWFHEAGGGRLLLIVSIKQRYPGHARQAAFVASQCQVGAYLGRYVVVVDDDIDPMNTFDVLWALSTRSDPVKDIDIIRRAWSGPLDPVIPRGPEVGFNSRAIVDACRPYEWIDKFPAVGESSPELQAKIMEKWGKIVGWQ